MKDLNSTIVATALLLLCGCLSNRDPGTQADSSSTGMTESTGTGASDPSRGSFGSSSGVTSATEKTSGATPDTSSGSADSSSSSDSGNGLPVCLDEGTWRGAEIELGRNMSDSQEWENVDATCVVSGFERGGGPSEYALTCDEGEAEPTVRLLHAPFIAALELGMTVRLRYLRQHVLDGSFYRAFAIHDIEGALVMGSYRNGLPSDAPTDPATFFEPFEFESVDGLCAGEAPGEDGGGTFIIDPCPFVRTPLGLSVTSGDQSTTILDGTTRSVGGYEFNVSAYFADFVDPEPGCGSSREFVFVNVFSEQK